MYLSRLVLNPRASAARHDLANPYGMHASLCWAFRKPETLPPTEGEGEGWERGKTVHSFLWRLEPPQRRNSAVMLVQSQTEPQWHVLTERTPDYLEQAEFKELSLEHLALGQALRFRLRANPTVTKRHDSRPDKQKRVGLYKPDDLLGHWDDADRWVPGWIERQGDTEERKRGFVVRAQDVTLLSTERLHFFKHKGGNPITLQSALFDGYLNITDLETFKKTLATGIGKAKGLGFGLLSIARA